MTDALLLILRIPAAGNNGVGMTRANGRVDIKPIQAEAQRQMPLIEEALACAQQISKPVIALLILNSDLFHWGYNDIILSGPAKARFIGHIREELMRLSWDTSRILEETGRRYGVTVEIRRVETTDPLAAALTEARNGYHKIFLSKEKKRYFPIFKKTVEQQLRKQTATPIISRP